MPPFGLGTGQESFIALAEETTYGTRATLTEFMRMVSENMKHNTNVLADSASLGEPARYHPIRVGVSTGGGFVVEPWITGIECLLKYALGDHFTTVNVTTAVYQHRFRIGRYLPSWKSAADPSFTSLTVDMYRGAPAQGYVWGYSGVLLDGLRLEFNATSPGRIAVGSKFNDSCVVVSPAVPSSTVNRLPMPTRLTIGLADPSTSTPTYTDVSAYSFSLNIPQGLDQEQVLGLNGGTNYPLPLLPHRRENLVKVSGQFTCLAGSATRTFDTGIGAFEKMMNQNLSAFMRVTADAGESCRTYGIGHTIELQNVHLTSTGPEVGDPGNIRRTVTFEAYSPVAGFDVSSVPSMLQWTVTNYRSGFGGR